MRAIQIEAPEKVGFGEVAQPQVGPQDVMLLVRRVGYCGSDLNTFRGLNPLASYPRVPGHEIAGEIVARGCEVPTDIQIGTLATVLPYTACGVCAACRVGRANACRDNQTLGVQRDGALTEYIAVPHDKLARYPALSEAQLALIEPLAVGFHAVERGRTRAEETVLIFGCGMIGLGAIAAAGLDRGARVIAVDVDDAKLALARECGAREVINSHTQPLEATVQELTGGNGASVVVEAVGLPQTFQAAVQVASFAGRVVYIGYARESVSYETKYFVMKEIDILGSRNSTPADFDRVAAMLSRGVYPVEKTINRTVPFEAGAEALESWSRNPAVITKVHVTF